MSDSLTRVARALARCWVTLYTVGVGGGLRERRLAEVESDVWEAMNAENGGGSVVALVEVVDRLVRGVPADLMWWFEARRVAGGRREGGETPDLSFDPGSLSPAGRIAFQALASAAILGAFVRVGEQLLRVPEFKEAIPLESPGAVAAIVVLYCIPPVTALLACTVAIPLVVRAERLPEARSLALFLAFLSLFWAAVLSFFYFLPSTEPGQLNFGGAVGPGASAWAYTWFVLAIVAFLRFSTLFPRRLSPEDVCRSTRLAPLPRLQRLSMLPVFVWCVAGLLVLVMAAPAVGRPWTQDVPPVDVTWNRLWILAVGRMLLGYVVIPIAMMAVGVANLYTGLRTASESDRSRSLWLFAGFSTAFWMVAVAVVVLALQDFLSDVFFLLMAQVVFAPLVIVVCLAVAVYYRGDLDPSLVIRRGTVYGVIGVLFVAALAAAEGLASEFLSTEVGVPVALGDALLATIAALLMIPVKGRLSQWTARFDPGREHLVERAS